MLGHFRHRQYLDGQEVWIVSGTTLEDRLRHSKRVIVDGFNPVTGKYVLRHEDGSYSFYDAARLSTTVAFDYHP